MNKHMREDFEAAAIGQACWKALRNEAGPCASCNQDQLLDAQGNPSGMHHWEGQNPLTGKWYINYDRAITWVDGRLARLQVSMDITGHKRLEEQLRQAQKMEAVGRLAGGIAHDFNNLLTAINGFAELMRSRLAPDDPLYEMADKVLGSGRRAADLTRQLLAFSRKQVVEPRVVDLNAVVADMDKMLRRIIGEDIQLQTIAGPGLWPVKVDPTQIEQIIVNLAVNARDAMPQGGRLTVETANVSPLHLPLPLRGQVPSPGQAGRGEEEGGGEYVLLAIGDTGVGMNEAVKAHLFEPFFTTKEEGKGTGLGLAMVYGIVQQSGGVIRIDSQEGLGAAVKIYLPRVAAAVTAPTGTEPATSLPAGSETVLLVEDDPGVRVLAARVLRRQGYCVWEAADGPQALRLAAEQGGPIHLLLSDVVMPGMSGRILADRLVAERPQLKILFTSGYADEALLHHGVLQSGAPFLQKPFTPEALARKVREVLDSRQ
jgi:signal transduction histidine kinase/CheY-like chemotaxis protein